jgi:glycosyltransferase involved in cell wall biosynthesis
MAESLAKLNHNVLVMEFPEEKSPNLMKSKERIKFVHLRGNEISYNRVSRMLRNILTFDPFHSIKFQLYSLIELIRYRHYLKDSELIFVEGTLIPFGIILPKMLKKKVILDSHCVNKLLALYFKDKNRLVYYTRKIIWDFLERFAMRQSDIVIVVSKDEKDFIHKEFGISRSKISVVPNVVEVPGKKCSKGELDDLKKTWNLDKKIIVTFVGDLESVQNADAVKYITDKLAPWFWKKRKDVVFVVIGRGGNFHPNLPSIVFTGFVPSITPFLYISDICIAPLRVGAGTKTKVLEYLAHAKPVITTPIGIEGLQNLKIDANEISECRCIIVSNIENFPSALLKAINNLDELRQKAIEYVPIIKKHYSSDGLSFKLEDLIKRVKQ